MQKFQRGLPLQKDHGDYRAGDCDCCLGEVAELVLKPIERFNQLVQPVVVVFVEGKEDAG